MQAGLDVLTEKPIAVEIAEADRMVAEAERLGRVLAVSFQHRTRTEVQEARRLVQDGSLGDHPARRSAGDLAAPSRLLSTARLARKLARRGRRRPHQPGPARSRRARYVAGYPNGSWPGVGPSSSPSRPRTRCRRWSAGTTGATGFIHISTAEFDEEQRLEITGTGGRLRLTRGRLEVLRNDVDMRDHAVSPGNPYQSPPTLDLEVTEGTGGKHAEIYRDLIAARAEGRPPIAPGSAGCRPWSSPTP